jgi:hypothetical protein
MEIDCAISPGGTNIFHPQKVFYFALNNTIPVCVSKCEDLNYRFAYVELGSLCGCGDTYVDDTPPARVPIKECGDPCDGDTTVKCGGYERASVYRTRWYSD